MADLLLATDASWLVDDLRAALEDPDTSFRIVTRGHEVRPAVIERAPDLLITDLQVGNMGGMAITHDLRLEERSGRLPHVPTLMLLDRRADVFLARRSAADAWMVKPLDAFRLRRAVTAVLAGEGRFEGTDESEWPTLRALARGEEPPEPVAADDTEADTEADPETEDATTTA